MGFTKYWLKSNNGKTENRDDRDRIEIIIVRDRLLVSMHMSSKRK